MTERHIGRGWPNLIPVGILLLTSATTHAEGADGARGIGSHEVARSIVDYQFNEVGHVVYTTRTIGLFGTSYKRFETICDGSRMTLSLGSGDTYDEALQNSLTKGNAALLIFLADDELPRIACQLPGAHAEPTSSSAPDPSRRRRR